MSASEYLEAYLSNNTEEISKIISKKIQPNMDRLFKQMQTLHSEAQEVSKGFFSNTDEIPKMNRFQQMLNKLESLKSQL